jgi:hypothetical protein
MNSLLTRWTLFPEHKIDLLVQCIESVTNLACPDISLINYAVPTSSSEYKWVYSLNMHESYRPLLQEISKLTASSKYFHSNYYLYLGTQYRSWLRNYATSRKVAGSNPDEVIGFFNWPNPSSRTMALGSTQPLTEMSIRNLPGGEGRQARKADNFTVICESLVYKMWEPRRLTTLWASTICYEDSFVLF